MTSTLCISIAHPDWPEEFVPAMVTVDKAMNPVSLVIMHWKPIENYSQYVIDSVREQIRNGDFV